MQENSQRENPPHVDKIHQMCDDAGVLLLYFPLYSPDFNLIEEMFGELKTYIRQVWDEHIGFVRADFLGFLEKCVTVVGARKPKGKCQRSFPSCWYLDG